MADGTFYYSSRWTLVKDGETIDFGGQRLTKGVDAFSDYSLAKAAAGESGTVQVCDKFYSSTWKDTTEETVKVVLNGETVTLNVGTEAFTTLKGARDAAGTTVAFVEYEMSYATGGGSRPAETTAAGQFLVYNKTTDTGSAWNASHISGNFDNITILFNGDSNFTKFNRYSTAYKDKHTTVIVDDATIGSIGTEALSSTGSVSFDEKGRAVWEEGKTHAVSNLFIRKNSNVSTVWAGAYASPSTGEINTTIDHATINKYYGTGENNNGHTFGSQTLTLKSGTINEFVAAHTATGGQYSITIVAEEGSSRIGSITDNTARCSAVDYVIKDGATLDLTGTTLVYFTSITVENNALLALAGWQGNGEVLLTSGGTVTTAGTDLNASITVKGGARLQVNGAFHSAGNVVAEKGAQMRFNGNFANDGGHYTFALEDCLTITGSFTNTGTITIDADGFAFDPGVSAVKVVDSGSTVITSVARFEVINGIEGKQLFTWNGDVWYGTLPAYYSAGWVGKTGTVNTPDGTATMGENAFATYEEMIAYNPTLYRFIDYYIVPGASVGDEITFCLPSGTFTATIDEKTFFKGTGPGSTSDAWSNFTDYSGNEIVVYGGTLAGTRNNLLNCGGKKTAFYDYTMIATGTDGTGANVAPAIVVDNVVTGSAGEVIIGRGCKAQSVYGSRSNSVDMDVTIRVQDDGMVEFLNINSNGTVTSTATYTIDAVTGKLLWNDAEGAHSKATFYVSGGSVGAFTTTTYAGGYTGDIYLNISGDAYISSFNGRGTNTTNSNFFVNMTGGTIKTFNGGNGTGDRYIEIVVGGTAENVIGAMSNMNIQKGVDFRILDNASLVTNAGLTFKGSFSLGEGASFTGVNFTLGADKAVSLGADAKFTCADLTLTNGGTLALDSGASITCNNMGFTGTVITLASGAAITCAGATTLTDASVTVDAGASITSGVFKNQGSSTITVGKGADMVFNSSFTNAGSYTFALEDKLHVAGTLTNTGTITIDADGFAFDPGVIAVKVIDAGYDITSLTGYNVINGETGKKLFLRHGDIWYGEEKYVYFSDDWKDLDYNTPVEVDGGTHFIGTDAFFKYADAEPASKEDVPLKSPDNFFSYDWKNKTGEQTVIYRGGTFKADISNANAYIKLFNKMEDAQAAAETTGSLLIVGGSSVIATSGSARYAWNYKNTVVTNTQMTASASVNGAALNIGGAGRANKFTVGEGAYVYSIAAGKAGYDQDPLTVESSTIEVIDGGTVTNLFYSNAAGGILTGEVNLTLKGGTVGTIKPCIGVGAGNTGNVNISITDNSYVGEMQMGGDSVNVGAEWTLAAGYHLTVTLADSTIYRLRSYGTIIKGEGASIDLHVTGTANILYDGGQNLRSGLSKFDSLSIKVDENAGGLTVGYDFGYKGTITVDLADCKYEQGRYLILSSPVAVDTTRFDLQNVDPVKSEGYSIVAEGTNYYYQATPYYFSDDWVEFAGSTATFPVIVDGGTHTYNVDAFFKYADAKTAAAGKHPLKSPDNFFSYDWKNQTGEQTVVYRGGTFKADISNAKADIKLFNNLGDAQAAAGTTGSLLIVGGTSAISTTEGGRNAWNYKNTVVTNAYLYLSADKLNGASLNIGAAGSSNKITVGEGAYVHSVGAGHQLSTGSALTVESSTMEVVDGGRVTSVFMSNSYAGALTGTVNVKLDGGTASVLKFSVTNSSNDGDINVSVTNDSYVGTFRIGTDSTGGTWTLTGGHCMTITLADSTINSFEKYGTVSKGADASINLKVTGSAAINQDASSGLAQLDSLSIKVDENAGGLTVGGAAFSYKGTITVDLSDCQYDQGRYLILSSPVAIDTTRFDLQGGDSTKGYSIFAVDTNYYYQAAPYYFSDDWVEFAGSTGTFPVIVDGGTHTYNVDAFFRYADAETAADGKHPLKSPDNFFSYDWEDKTGEQTVVYRGGTFKADISNANADIKLFNNLGDAQAAAKTTGSLLIVGGNSVISTTTGGRNQWNYKNTVLTNTRMTTSVTVNGAAINIGSAGSSNKFTVGEGAYVQSISPGHSSSSVTVESSTIEVVDGGSVGALRLSMGYGGTLTGTVNVKLDGGTVDSIDFGLIGATNDGDVNISITNDSYIGTFFVGNSGQAGTPWTLTADHHVTITLADSTINAFRKYSVIAKGEEATIDLKVTGAAAINQDVSSGLAQLDSLTIKVDENAGGLTVGGSVFSYNGTITADIRDCQHTQAKYLIISAPGVSVDDITVVGTQSSDYELAQVGGAIYYQHKPVYFSVAWENLTDTTPVKFGKKDLTIGVDAFRTYSDALAAGFSIVDSADIYVNSTYNATDPIPIPSGTENYIATFGVNAFADPATAVKNVQTGGAFRVTGGSFYEIVGMDNIEYVEIKNVTTTASVDVQKTATTEAKGVKLVIADSTIGNAINVVKAGSVNGSVQVSLDGVTAKSMYGLYSGTTVTGDLVITVDGDSVIKEGIYANEATVTGKVTVTLGDCTLGKRGIYINGTAGDVCTITVTGNAVVSTINNADKTEGSAFQTVTVNEGAVLSYGTDDVSGRWDQEKYLRAIDTLVNNGTFNYNAAIGQNAYHTVAYNVSGNALTSEVGNVFFDNAGTTMAAEVQKEVYYYSGWTEGGFLGTVEFGSGTFYKGLSAFESKGDAKASTFTDDNTILYEAYAQHGNVEGGDDGKLAFAGSTVTGQAFAGGELAIKGVNGVFGDYKTLVAGQKVIANAEITTNSRAVVDGTAENLKIKGVFGGSFIEGGNATVSGTTQVTVNGGSIATAVVGGCIVANQTEGSRSIVTQTGNATVNVNGGIVGNVIGGGFIQSHNADGAVTGALKFMGSTEVNLAGGTVVGAVFGGNAGLNVGYCDAEADFGHGIEKASYFGGNSSINIDVSGENKLWIVGGNGEGTSKGCIIAGNQGMGGFNGDTQVTFTGKGENLYIQGKVIGGNSNGSDAGGASGVAGTRSLIFNDFQGDLNTRQVIGFSNVSLTGSEVAIGNANFKEVDDWSFAGTESSLTWTSGKNNFAGDTLTLTSATELGGDGWTFLTAASDFFGNWDKFGSVTATIGSGETETLTWNDVGCYVGTNYTLNRVDGDETSSLKLAKLA